MRGGGSFFRTQGGIEVLPYNLAPTQDRGRRLRRPASRTSEHTVRPSRLHSTLVRYLFCIFHSAHFTAKNMQNFHKNSVKFHSKYTKKSRFPVFWGKVTHFIGFPPFHPLFHIDFPPLKRKTVEVHPFHPQKMGKTVVNLSHFQRSFPQKNRRKPLILRGFRRFSTVCSQVEIRRELYLNFE